MRQDWPQVLPKRLGRLEVMRSTRMIANAVSGLARAGSALEQVRLRQRFVRYGDVRLQTDVNAWRPRRERTLPKSGHRPPIARIISPRGIALRLYLIALCEAQMRHRGGEYPNNVRLIKTEGSKEGWTDLIAIPTEEPRTRQVNDRKKRWLLSALSRLADDAVGLVHATNAVNKRGRFEGFELLDEGGVRSGGSDLIPYRVPRHNESNCIAVPFGLFANGWIHVLEDVELQFVLTLMSLRAMWGDEHRWLEVSECVRLKNFGLGRDAYSTAYRMLEQFGLIDVRPGRGRDADGQILEGYHWDGLYHNFRLRPNGFNRNASDVVWEVLNHLLASGWPLPHITDAHEAP